MEDSQDEHPKYWAFDGRIQSREAFGIYLLKMDWLRLSQGITKDIEAAITSKSSTDICPRKSESCWYIICGWFYHSMKNCSFKPRESDATVHFCGGTAGRLTTGNRLDQSVGGEIGQVMAVAAVAVAVAA